MLLLVTEGFVCWRNCREGAIVARKRVEGRSIVLVGSWVVDVGRVNTSTRFFLVLRDNRKAFPNPAQAPRKSSGNGTTIRRPHSFPALRTNVDPQ